MESKNQTEKIIYYYDENAKTYDRTRFSSKDGKILHLMHKRKLLSMCADKFHSKTILDIGAGTGRFTLELSEKASFVIGIDPSKKMLKVAKQKAKSASKNILFICAVGDKLPLKDNSTDLCISINVLNHLPNYHSVLEEVGRVIKRKGVFVTNFPNLISFFLPTALYVNMRSLAIGKTVYSKWFSLTSFTNSLGRAGFKIDEIRGIPLISTILSLPHHLHEILERLAEKSFLRFFSAVIFIRCSLKLKNAVTSN